MYLSDWRFGEEKEIHLVVSHLHCTDGLRVITRCSHLHCTDGLIVISSCFIASYLFFFDGIRTWFYLIYQSHLKSKVFVCDSRPICGNVC